MAFEAGVLIEGDDDQLEPVGEPEVEEAYDPEVEEGYSVEYSISSYGADYPVDALVKRVNQQTILIPQFQRSYVWNVQRASRFVESLLIGLPVPSIFLYREPDTATMLVIDGQQRLRTLQYYYGGVFEPDGRAFKLRGVQTRYSGKGYADLDADDRNRLDDAVVHAIVVKQEDPPEAPSPGVGPSSIYHLFERLNTGGVLLQSQEIRSCIYHGGLMELLEVLNAYPDWRAMFGRPSARMRDRELILRFLALYQSAGRYTKPMTEFLNGFAEEHREPSAQTSSEFTSLFQEVISLARSSIGDGAFRAPRAINAALFDAITVGLARRLSRGPITQPERLAERYRRLCGSRFFQEAYRARTTDEKSVARRLRLSTVAFGDVL